MNCQLLLKQHGTNILTLPTMAGHLSAELSGLPNRDRRQGWTGAEVASKWWSRRGEKASKLPWQSTQTM
jgi:hypothetical protein